MLLNVVVPAYNVGFVKKGKFVKMITEGFYWWLDGDQVELVSMNKPFTVPPFDLEVYLADPEVAAALLVIDVPDNNFYAGSPSFSYVLLPKTPKPLTWSDQILKKLLKLYRYFIITDRRPKSSKPIGFQSLFA